jgi:hypothetical protein
MFKSVLADERLLQARFVLADGPTILIPVAELRRVLPLGRDHYFSHEIWGPFNIDPNRGTIDGHKIEIHVVA